MIYISIALIFYGLAAVEDLAFRRAYRYDNAQWPAEGVERLEAIERFRDLRFRRCSVAFAWFRAGVLAELIYHFSKG